mgnify:FL=1
MSHFQKERPLVASLIKSAQIIGAALLIGVFAWLLIFMLMVA